jgi:hypothetical protein
MLKGLAQGKWSELEHADGSAAGHANAMRAFIG